MNMLRQHGTANATQVISSAPGRRRFAVTAVTNASDASDASRMERLLLLLLDRLGVAPEAVQAAWRGDGRDR